MLQTATVKVFVPDFLEKIEKEGAILSLNFVTLRCGILTVTLRARYRARLSYQAEWNV